jgi:hypothetical protein
MPNIDINLLGTNIENNFFEHSLELFFQEISMCFNLKLTDFWGHINFLNLQKYVFSKNISASEVNKRVHEYILHNCSMSMSYDWNIETSFLKSQRADDLLYIKFNVNSNGESYTTQFILGPH